jgi:uncharacterized membrane protein
MYDNAVYYLRRIGLPDGNGMDGLGFSDQQELQALFRHIVVDVFYLRNVYAVLIMCGEFVAGTLLKRADFCPWDYSAARYNVKGVVRLDYFPAWVIAGLFYEQIYWLLAG